MYNTEELHGKAHMMWLSIQEWENCSAVISFNPYIKPKGQHRMPIYREGKIKELQQLIWLDQRPIANQYWTRGSHSDTDDPKAWLLLLDHSEIIQDTKGQITYAYPIDH